MNNFTTVFRYNPPKKGRNIAWFWLFSFPWLIRLTLMSGIWWQVTLISNVRYQKKHNESDIKLEFQNLVLFMIIGTKSSKSRCLLSICFAIFYQFELFGREYRARKACIPHLNERYVTKPQTLHNNVQKTRPRYPNLERFHWGSVFARKKKPLCRYFQIECTWKYI